MSRVELPDRESNDGVEMERQELLNELKKKFNNEWPKRLPIEGTSLYVVPQQLMTSERELACFVL